MIKEHKDTFLIGLEECDLHSVSVDECYSEGVYLHLTQLSSFLGPPAATVFKDIMGIKGQIRGGFLYAVVYCLIF